VYVGSGSRQDTLETTGSAYLLTKMLSRGTSSQTKASFAEEIEGMGGSLSSDVEREQSSIGLKIMNSLLHWTDLSHLGKSIDNGEARREHWGRSEEEKLERCINTSGEK
jgi:hypothetical protein